MKTVREQPPSEKKEDLDQSIFKSAPDGLIIADLETGRVLEANPAACAMHGYEYPLFIGQLPQAFIHPHSQDVFVKFLQDSNSSGPLDARLMHIRRDGSIFQAEWHATAFSYQDRLCLLGMVRDVSQRLQAEQLLKKRAKARSRQQAALLEMANLLAATPELQPELVLVQLRGMINYTHAALFSLTGSTLASLAVRISPDSPKGRRQDADKRGGQSWRKDAAPLQVLLSNAWTLRALINGHRPIRIADISRHQPPGQFFRDLLKGQADVLLEGMHGWLWVPVAVKSRLLGGLILAHERRKYYTAKHASLALAIADQLATSLSNASWNEQARVLAVQQERQRLAQNLHDAVNQSLFSAGLIAEVLPRLWESDPPDARQSLEDLRRLMRGSLAEMRAILVELRPSVLTDSSLGDLLRQLANAFTGRTNVPVSLYVAGEHVLPANIQVLLYRICQEALNNVAKHSGARRVRIDLQYEAEAEQAALARPESGLTQEIAVKAVEMHIRDDGRGFNPNKLIKPGHYGLGMMRERAEAAGAQLTFTSRRGHGTVVTLRWQNNSNQELP